MQPDRLWLIRPIRTRKALPHSVVDPSNTGTEGTAAFRTLVNFLGRWQEDYFRLAHLAFSLSEVVLFCSAQREQCLC